MCSSLKQPSRFFMTVFSVRAKGTPLNCVDGLLRNAR
jgi:hypothetical protein